MTHSVRSPTKPASPPAGRETPSGLETELSVVLEALALAASSRAATVLSDARRETSIELGEADAEARHLIQQARAEGDESASRSAAIMSARTRRQAHEEVLAARRSVVETLRHRAAETLERRAATPEGGVLVDYLQSIVNARVGLTPSSGMIERPGAVGVITAQTGNRRATARLEDIVDSVLNMLAPEVESLWT